MLYLRFLILIYSVTRTAMPAYMCYYLFLCLLKMCLIQHCLRLTAFLLPAIILTALVLFACDA